MPFDKKVSKPAGASRAPRSEREVRYELFRLSSDPTLEAQVASGWTLPHAHPDPWLHRLEPLHPAVADAAERAVGARPPLARPPTPTYRLSDFLGGSSGSRGASAAADVEAPSDDEESDDDVLARVSATAAARPAQGARAFAAAPVATAAPPSMSMSARAPIAAPASASMSASAAPPFSLYARAGGASSSSSPAAAAAAAPALDVSALQARWDVRGGDKWKEFIDRRHHGRGKFGYDEFDPAGAAIAKPGSDQYYSFLRADAATRESLGRPMDAALYVSIHRAASAGLPADKQRLREGAVQWRLAAPPGAAQRAEITGAKPYPLAISADPRDEDRVVQVPALKDGQNMEDVLDQLFARHHQRMASGQGSAIDNIAQTYKELETLHPAQDGSARTNHLVLNKLLTEAGHVPIVLDEPDAPSTRLPVLSQRIAAEAAETARIKPPSEDSAASLTAEREYVRQQEMLFGFVDKLARMKQDDPKAAAKK